MKFSSWEDASIDIVSNVRKHKQITVMTEDYVFALNL